MMSRMLLVVIWITVVRSELPTELSPFLDKLFETDECEDYIGDSEFTKVNTSSCEPYTCDFPRQLCVRPAESYQDKSTNMCSDIPTKCITAANGGVPVGPSMRPAPTLPPPTLPPFMVKQTKGGLFPTRMSIYSVFGNWSKELAGDIELTSRPNVIPMEICQMGAPNGRFCGFKVMYTYNKETFQCDEFWFPGCATADTNANLFSDYQSCQKIADICKPKPTTQAPTLPPTTQPPPTTPPPPPPPPPPPSPFGGFGGFGGSPNPAPQPSPSGGMGGGFAGLLAGLGGGAGGGGAVAPAAGGATGQEGEDLGLIGLIQQGLMSAQAIKQGGPQGKQAAGNAAGQILQQFTGFDLNNIGGNFGNLFNGK